MTDKELDGLQLHQVGAGVYKTDDKQVYRLAKVDREYPNRKAPCYYLQQLLEGKAAYISGVFETKNRDILSMDLKDRLGVKTYFDIMILEGGKALKIQRRR